MPTNFSILSKFPTSTLLLMAINLFILENTISTVNLKKLSSFNQGCLKTCNIPVWSF